METSAEWIRLLSVHTVQVGWRLHRLGHDPEFYFWGPARYVPDEPDVGVLYLAEDELTATVEFAGGLEAVRNSDLEKYLLSELHFPSPLHLVDTTSKEFRETGVDLNELQSEDYFPSQEFATAVYNSGLNGVAFKSRSNGRLFAIFGPVGEGKEAKTGREIAVPRHFLKKMGIEVLHQPEADRWAGAT